MEQIMNYIKPELLVVAVVLYFIGMGLKKAQTFKDKYIPLIDQSLKLNIAPSTEIMTSNGQRFTCSLGGQLLVVYYSATTRSIPPQTTPRRIIVMC